MIDVLLLAAGLGTRLRPLTDLIPKALLPLHGAALLDIHIHRLLRGLPGEPPGAPPADVGRIVINAHHLALQVEAHVRRHPLAARLELSLEPEILGTGGAIVAAGDRLTTGVFAVLNADALFRAPLSEALAFHREHGHLATMVLTGQPLHPNVHVLGGRVRRIDRLRTDPGAYTFTGTHLLSRELVKRMPSGEFHDIRDTYDHLARDRRLGAFVVGAGDRPLLDVGTPAAYLEGHWRCTPATGSAYGIDPELLSPPASASIGYGYLSPRARVAPGARVRDSVILDDAVVEEGVTVTESIVAPGTHVCTPARRVVVTPAGRRPIDDGGNPLRIPPMNYP